MSDEKKISQSQIDDLKKMRIPFDEKLIGKLPKPTKKQTDMVRDNYTNGSRCDLCGTWHHKDVVHLDYIGHAALTDRLLDVDPMWTWEPVAFGPDGLPLRDKDGGMWIRLTVCGVTRLGYGDAAGKTGANATKEIIGDALRNAGMRFGAALDLWHKGILHLDMEDDQAPSVQKTALGAKGFSAALEAVKKGEYTVAAIKATHVLNIDQETALEDVEKEAKK